MAGRTDIEVAGALDERRDTVRPGNQRGRRVADIVVSALLLIVIFPLLLVVMMVVYLVDGGPVVFHSLRDGAHGRAFNLPKVRTMRRDAELVLQRLLDADPALAAQYAERMCLVDDPRVLPVVGRLLRRFSIDELPQLVSVLRGDMTLVGPRPLPLHLVAMLPADYIAERRQVKPGLTGLWQVSGRSDNDIDGWINLDVEYVRTRCLRRDLMILARTPKALLGGRGAH